MAAQDSSSLRLWRRLSSWFTLMTLSFLATLAWVALGVEQQQGYAPTVAPKVLTTVTNADYTSR